MFEQFRDFLVENWPGAVIGITVWTVMCKVRPDWVQAWNGEAGKRWGLMALFSLGLFGGGAVLAWHDGRLYVAIAMGAFTLYVVAMWIRRGWQGDLREGITPQR